MTVLGRMLLGGAASAAMLGSAAAETLIVAHDLPPMHVFSVEMFEAFMQCVTEATDGAYDFDYFPGGTVLKRDEGVTGIQDGLAHISFVTPAFETARMPMQSVTMLPGLGDSAASVTAGWRKALDQGGELAGEWETVGVVPLTVSALAPYQVASGPRVTIDTAGAFSGKKLRSVGSSMNYLVESLGGVAVQMPAPEIYTAIQRGTVDGTMISFGSIKPYSLQEVISAISRNASFGTGTQALGIGADTFNGLPPEHQVVFTDCGAKVEVELAEGLDAEESTIADEFVGLGINVFEFSDDELALFNEGVSKVAEDFISRLTVRDIPADVAYQELMSALGN